MLATAPTNQLRQLQKRTAMRRVPRHVLQRNVAVALGNTRSPDAVPPLLALLANRTPLVRAHAAWALGQIDPAHPALAELRATETDPLVCAELLQEAG
jgi:epoxyqueuosine reductase